MGCYYGENYGTVKCSYSELAGFQHWPLGNGCGSVENLCKQFLNCFRGAVYADPM